MDTMDPTAIVALLTAYLGFVAVIAFFFILVYWKIFTKAEQPGWAALVPFYNIYVLTQILKRPQWWMVLYFASIIPFVGSFVVIVVSILDNIRLAKVFGKGTGFGIGLVLLSFIFAPMLAFGNATYDPSQVDE